MVVIQIAEHRIELAQAIVVETTLSIGVFQNHKLIFSTPLDRVESVAKIDNVTTIQLKG